MPPEGGRHNTVMMNGHLSQGLQFWPQSHWNHVGVPQKAEIFENKKALTIVSSSILATNNTVVYAPSNEDANKETHSHLVIDTGEAFLHCNLQAAVSGGRHQCLGVKASRASADTAAVKLHGVFLSAQMKHTLQTPRNIQGIRRTQRRICGPA